MSHPNSELVRLEKHEAFYKKNPMLWLRYGKLIEEVEKVIFKDDLKFTSELYLIPSHLSHCEQSLEMLKEEIANDFYEDFGCKEELNKIEQHLEYLIKKLEEIKETEECDLDQEITFLENKLKKSNGKLSYDGV